MSKAADMAKISAKGGFHLLWGLVVSTVISSVGTIFIARLLSSELFGLYTVALAAPNLIIVFRDWGVNSAMIRYTAQCRAEGKPEEIRNIVLSGLIFEIALGLALSLISFALSDFLATTFNRPAIAYLIQIASFTVLTGGLINAATAAFVGMEKMELNSIMLVCQSIIKTALVIGLVVLGLGTFGAILGFAVAALIGGFIGVFLMWTIYKELPKPTSFKLEIVSNVKVMFKYGMPLSLSGIIGGFQTQFYAFLLPIFYATESNVIGNFGIAVSFVVLINFFATPITTMLFPAFSKLDPQKDKETLRNVFQFSIKYASLLVVPAAALVMSLSEPAVSTLFGVTYGVAPLFLALLAVSYVYTAFGSLSVGNLINSQGQTTFNLYLTVLSAIIGVPMGLVLILNFGVIGLIVPTLTAGIPGFFISVGWAKNRYGVTVDWISSAKIIFSSSIAAALTFALVFELGFASWLRLIIGVLFFVPVFIVASVLTETVNWIDINNLRGMVSSLGPLSRIFNKILDVIEKLLVTLRPDKNHKREPNR